MYNLQAVLLYSEAISKRNGSAALFLVAAFAAMKTCECRKAVCRLHRKQQTAGQFPIGPVILKLKSVLSAHLGMDLKLNQLSLSFK